MALPLIRTALERTLPPPLKWKLVLAQRRLADRFAGSALGRLAGPLLVRRYLARPDEIDIEVTSSCDADCIMCPRRRMRRRPGPMPLSLFTKIVDEAVALGVRDLVLNGYGEIATLRNCREYLACIRERSRHIRVVINTNGMRMTQDIAAAFVDHAVDVVNIAIDGATAETFESIRKELRLDVVEANVHRLVAIRRDRRRRRPFIMVHMIHMPENAHEADAFLQKWTRVVDHAGIAGYTTRGGSLPLHLHGTRQKAVPCFLLWRQMPVLSDGTVALCCDDWDGSVTVGNLHTDSIRDVWTSTERRRLRALHLEGRAGQIDLCAACHNPRQPPWWFSDSQRS